MCVDDFLVVYQFVIPLFELIVFAKFYPNIGKDEIRDFLIVVLKKFSSTHLSNACGATVAQKFPREVAFQPGFLDVLRSLCFQKSR